MSSLAAAAAGLLALLGTPLFVVLAAVTLFLLFQSGIDLSIAIVEMNRMAEMPLLAAIPLFALAGYILAESRAPQRLVKFSHAILGWLPGGFAIISLITCALFTAFTGASGITIVALGGLLLPGLIKERYGENFSYGLLTTSGSLGLLFPPSLPLILYGVVSETNIEKLFLAGIVPGLIMLLVLVIYSMRSGIAAGVSRAPFSWREARKALWESAWELPLPVVVLGGIYGGFVAVSEAAALTALYVLIVESFIRREVTWKKLYKAMLECMILVGAVLIILGAALAFTNYLIDAQIPMKTLELFESHISNRITFLLMLNVFLLLVGCILDIFSSLVVVVPLVLPIAHAYGVDPIHLGVIFLANLQLGYSTPPVGMNLFIASLRFEQPVGKLYVASLPFLILLLLVLFLITYLPELSLWLPGLV